VVVSFFGEGAANQGSFHEAVNLASVWHLPIIFLCENNKYAISTHFEQAFNIGNISDRARGYGIPGVTVYGNNVVEMYKVVGEAIARCRDNQGPTLIEADTYRLSGHYFGDSQSYRCREEVDEWKERDPLIYCAGVLANDYGVEKEVLEQIDREEMTRVADASEAAKQDPEPEVTDLTQDLYDPTFADIKWVPFDRSA
jgi:pyruvate dehydrogenase E1 component alpha subunit